LVRKLSGTSDPNFNVNSLAGIGDSLRTLGELSRLQAAAFNEMKKKVTLDKDHPLRRNNSLPQDAFELWGQHYQSVGQPSMVRRMKRLAKVFEFLLHSGMSGQGLRLLDHGVCSGLLLLLYTTDYFSIYFGLGDSPPKKKTDSAPWTRFRKDVPSPNAPVFAHWWWSGIVWGTAACALHNVQQMSQSDLPVDLKEEDHPLSIEEDPLAYLGILVDCVQEWDRYTTSQESVIGGRLPLQGTDVTLCHKDDVIHLGLPKRFADDASKALNGCLQDWSQYLQIEAI
jgi:hypothetical protein